MFQELYEWFMLDPAEKSLFRQWVELILLYLVFAGIVLAQGELPFGWVLAISLLLLGGLFRSGREFLRIALIAAVLVFGIIRPFVVQAFYIPSRSMENTLLINDHIFVNKFVYYFANPQRWDIVVFEYPPDPEKDYIKRLVGKPGDKIALREHKLIINGETVPRRYVSSEIFLRGFVPNRTREIKSGTVRVMGDGLKVNGSVILNGEGTTNPLTLQGEVLKINREAGNHQVKIAPSKQGLNDGFTGQRSFSSDEFQDFTREFGPIKIPRPGEVVDLSEVSELEFRYYLFLLRQRHPEQVYSRNGTIYRRGKPVEELEITSSLYFVMGDNRDHSEDSRFWGFVPANRLLGEAFFIYWPPLRMGLIGN